MEGPWGGTELCTMTLHPHVGQWALMSAVLHLQPHIAPAGTYIRAGTREPIARARQTGLRRLRAHVRPLENPIRKNRSDLVSVCVCAQRAFYKDPNHPAPASLQG